MVVVDFAECRLVLDKRSRELVAQVEHHSGRIVLQGSSSEWSLAKQLYKTNDTCAYVNFGKVYTHMASIDFALGRSISAHE